MRLREAQASDAEDLYALVNAAYAVENSLNSFDLSIDYEEA